MPAISRRAAAVLHATAGTSFCGKRAMDAEAGSEKLGLESKCLREIILNSESYEDGYGDVVMSLWLVNFYSISSYMFEIKYPNARSRDARLARCQSQLLQARQRGGQHNAHVRNMHGVADLLGTVRPRGSNAAS